MNRMSIAFICGIPADQEKNLDLIQAEFNRNPAQEKNLHLIQAEFNRNPRRNKQIRPPIIDPDNSDGSQSDEFCAPKETKGSGKVKAPKKKHAKTGQKAGEENFLLFARVHNPESAMEAGSGAPPAEKTYTIPSPVLLSENDD
jgi:hypothetical protein